MSTEPKKLSVALVFDDTLDSNDGVAQYVKTLGSFLSARGHKVSYLVGETRIREYRGDPVFSMAKNIRVKFNGNWLSIPLPARASEVNRVLAEVKPDILHVQAPYSPFLAQKIINRASAAAIIGTFHVLPVGGLAHFGTRCLKLLYGRSLSKFNLFLSVSQPAQTFASQTLGIKSQIIPNVVDLAAFKRANGPKANNIVFLGRLVRRKGCQYLLRAFAEVVAAHPDAALTIAGDGPERAKLEKLSERLGIGDKVSFLGYIDEKYKPSLLAGASVACFPSTGGESFGIVLVEAMAAGTQVVLAGANPGYASVMQANEEVLFRPTDVAGLAKKINRLLEDEKFANKIHGWQQQLVKQYDVNLVGPKIEQLYWDEVLKKGSNKA